MYQFQEKVKNLLLYGGLNKATHEKYREYILQQDMKNLWRYLVVTGFGFLLFGLTSLVVNRGVDVNTSIYFYTSAAILVLLILQYVLIRGNRVPVDWWETMIYAFMTIIYIEAIMVTMQHPDMPAVTAIGIMLMMPLLFARPPVGTILLQSGFACIFCAFAGKYKQPDAAFYDIWNGVTFYAVSVAAILIAVPIRIRSLAQNRLIKELSECDLLTGLRNRNSFERDCRKLAGKRQKTVVVYADANGLHELNNTKGHAAGDAMLKAVAAELRESFGKEGVYRIGGDEFVVILPEGQHRKVEGRLEAIGEAIEQQGYAASFGCAESKTPEEPLEAVIRRAESAMYAAKAGYYRAVGHDRRRRS